MSPTRLAEKSQKKGFKKPFSDIKRPVHRFFVAILIIVSFMLGVLMIEHVAAGDAKQIDNPKVAKLAKIKMPSWIDEQIIPKDCDSRRGEYLEDINGIVIHYVGNPGTTAEQNRDYFANPGTEVNSHFLVGLEGEIVQCLPLEEKSSASNDRNRDTISIEVCHMGEDGKFSKESYDALLRLTAWLCQACGVDETQVIRHYDVTGKECPIYYVKHPDAWEQFKQDLKNARELKD
ncbi:MAG: N-acetylmuramoyl-L-alanine amidase [Evtepia sp.]|nr:N-acetylmuramoyl-L-alanine amidase [Evtepia sp.]